MSTYDLRPREEYCLRYIEAEEETARTLQKQNPAIWLCRHNLTTENIEWGAPASWTIGLYRWGDMYGPRAIGKKAISNILGQFDRTTSFWPKVELDNTPLRSQLHEGKPSYVVTDFCERTTPFDEIYSSKVRYIHSDEPWFRDSPAYDIEYRNWSGKFLRPVVTQSPKEYEVWKIPRMLENTNGDQFTDDVELITKPSELDPLWISGQMALAALAACYYDIDIFEHNKEQSV